MFQDLWTLRGTLQLPQPLDGQTALRQAADFLRRDGKHVVQTPEGLTYATTWAGLESRARLDRPDIIGFAQKLAKTDTTRSTTLFLSGVLELQDSGGALRFSLSFGWLLLAVIAMALLFGAIASIEWSAAESATLGLAMLLFFYAVLSVAARMKFHR
ncbi:hypothetical protein DRY87_25860, partial [Salmonella enterica subsp. enterica serovar Newport]|nr:hypothetical protein [Salmonella enterica subsp. enterica serovar Newport]